MKIYNDSKLVYSDIKLASTCVKRFIGLMDKKSLNPQEGVLITKCNQVHMFHMKFPIDVIYLGKDMNVLHIETLKINQIGKKVKKAVAVLEVSAGSANKNNIYKKNVLETQDI